MKTGLDLIKNLYSQVIRHNLTQPEEIDRVLFEMAAEDMALETPLAVGARLVETALSGERSETAMAASLSYGIMHRITTPRLPDHYMFHAPRQVAR